MVELQRFGNVEATILFFLLPTFQSLFGQIPKDFYKNGFPKSTGTFEKGTKGISDIEFYYPTNYYNTLYDIQAIFPFEKVPKSKITKVTVNDKIIKDFVIFNNHVYSKFKDAKGEDDLVVACMSNWEYGKIYTVTVHGIKNNNDNFKISISAKSPLKNVSFNLKDNKFETKYVSIPLDVNASQISTLDEIIVNSLPVKNFELNNKILEIPLN